MATCQGLKSLIKAQLGEVLREDFDIGYLQNTTVISIRNKEDLDEVWDQIKNGKNITLWCDGLKTTLSTSRKRQLDEDSDDETSESGGGKSSKRRKKKNKWRRLLKEKNAGSVYTPMQYRIWGEMIAGGVHSSYEEHPNISMFQRAGGIRKLDKELQVCYRKQLLNYRQHCLLLDHYPQVVESVQLK